MYSKKKQIFNYPTLNNFSYATRLSGFFSLSVRTFEVIVVSLVKWGDHIHIFMFTDCKIN